MKRTKGSTSEGLGAEMHNPRTGNNWGFGFAAIDGSARNVVAIRDMILILTEILLYRGNPEVAPPIRAIIFWNLPIFFIICCI